MLLTHFIRRGYPKHLVLAALKKCIILNRNDLLNKDLLKEENKNTITPKLKAEGSNTFYCITTHNPQNPPIKTVVKSNWDLLQKTKTTRHLQDAQIIFGLRRNKNLSDQLVRASTRTLTTKGHHVEDHQCNHPNTC